MNRTELVSAEYTYFTSNHSRLKRKALITLQSLFIHSLHSNVTLKWSGKDFSLSESISDSKQRGSTEKCCTFWWFSLWSTHKREAFSQKGSCNHLKGCKHGFIYVCSLSLKLDFYVATGNREAKGQQGEEETRHKQINGNGHTKMS